MRVRTQARRDGIVELAIQLFEERGYEAASMSELAKRLGGSKTTLYGYFPSKDELLMAVVEVFATAHLSQATTRLLSTLEEGQVTTAPELKAVMTSFGDQVLQVLTNDRRALLVNRIVLAEAGRSNVGELFSSTGPRQCIEALTALMTAAMTRRVIVEALPDVLAQQFLSLLTAEVSARMYQQNPPPMSASEIHRRVVRAVDFFLKGCGCRV